MVGTSNKLVPGMAIDHTRWCPEAIVDPRSKWLIQDDAKIDVLIILTLPWRGRKKKTAQARKKKKKQPGSNKKGWW